MAKPSLVWPLYEKAGREAAAPGRAVPLPESAARCRDTSYTCTWGAGIEAEARTERRTHIDICVPVVSQEQVWGEGEWVAGVSRSE